MAYSSSDYFYGDDYDAIIACIDSDMLENDDEMKAEVNECLENMPTADVSGFKCQFCEKICLSKGGLKRHAKSKHPLSVKESIDNTAATDEVMNAPTAESKLLPSIFRCLHYSGIREIKTR